MRAEDKLSIVAASDDVVEGAFDFDYGFAGHSGGVVGSKLSNCNIAGPAPFPSSEFRVATSWRPI